MKTTDQLKNTEQLKADAKRILLERLKQVLDEKSFGFVFDLDLTIGDFPSHESESIWKHFEDDCDVVTGQIHFHILATAFERTKVSIPFTASFDSHEVTKAIHDEEATTEKKMLDFSLSHADALYTVDYTEPEKYLCFLLTKVVEQHCKKQGSRKPTHPGIMLRDEFLNAYRIPHDEFGKHIGEDEAYIHGLLRGESEMTPEVALKVSQALGTSLELWMNSRQRWEQWEITAYPPSEPIEPMVEYGVSTVER